MNAAHDRKHRKIQLIILVDVKVNDRRCENSFLRLSVLDLGICTAFELEVFPKRMNIWLGEILDALVSRAKQIEFLMNVLFFFVVCSQRSRC